MHSPNEVEHVKIILLFTTHFEFCFRIAQLNNEVEHVKVILLFTTHFVLLFSDRTVE